MRNSCYRFTVVTQLEETFTCVERLCIALRLPTLTFLPRLISVTTVHNPGLSVSSVQALSIASVRVA